MIEKGIIYTLGEVHQEDIKAADLLARLLLESGQANQEVELHLADGRKIRGVCFGEDLIVADGFIATSRGGKIEKFLPRK